MPGQTSNGYGSDPERSAASPVRKNAPVSETLNKTGVGVDQINTDGEESQAKPAEVYVSLGVFVSIIQLAVLVPFLVLHIRSRYHWKRTWVFLAELWRVHTALVLVWVGGTLALYIVVRELQDLMNPHHYVLLFTFGLLALQGAAGVSAKIWNRRAELLLGAYRAAVREAVRKLDSHFVLVGSGMLGRYILKKATFSGGRGHKGYWPVASEQRDALAKGGKRELLVLTDVVVVTTTREDVLAPFDEGEGVGLGICLFDEPRSGATIGCLAVIGDITSHAVRNFAACDTSKLLLSTTINDELSSQLLALHRRRSNRESHWVLLRDWGGGRQYEFDNFRSSSVTLVFPFDELARVLASRLSDRIYRQWIEDPPGAGAWNRVWGAGLDTLELGPYRPNIILTSAVHTGRVVKRVQATAAMIKEELRGSLSDKRLDGNGPALLVVTIGPSLNSVFSPDSTVRCCAPSADPGATPETVWEMTYREFLRAAIHRNTGSVSVFLPESTVLAAKVTRDLVSSMRRRHRDEIAAGRNELAIPKRALMYPKLLATLGGSELEVLERQLESLDESVIGIVGLSSTTGILNVPERVWRCVEPEMRRWSDPSEGLEGGEPKTAELTFCVNERIGGYFAILRRIAKMETYTGWLTDSDSPLPELIAAAGQGGNILLLPNLLQIDHSGGHLNTSFLRANLGLQTIPLPSGANGIAEARDILKEVGSVEYSDVVRSGAISASDEEFAKHLRLALHPGLDRFPKPKSKEKRLELFRRASNWELADAIDAAECDDGCPAMPRCPITAAKLDVDLEGNVKQLMRVATKPVGGTKRSDYLPPRGVWVRLDPEYPSTNPEKQSFKSLQVGIGCLEVQFDRSGQPGVLAALLASMLFQRLVWPGPEQTGLEVLAVASENCENSDYSYDHFYITHSDRNEGSSSLGKQGTLVSALWAFVIQLFPEAKDTAHKNRDHWRMYVARLAHFLNSGSLPKHTYVAFETEVRMGLPKMEGLNEEEQEDRKRRTRLVMPHVGALRISEGSAQHARRFALAYCVLPEMLCSFTADGEDLEDLAALLDKGEWDVCAHDVGVIIRRLLQRCLDDKEDASSTRYVAALDRARVIVEKRPNVGGAFDKLLVPLSMSLPDGCLVGNGVAFPLIQGGDESEIVAGLTDALFLLAVSYTERPGDEDSSLLGSDDGAMIGHLRRLTLSQHQLRVVHGSWPSVIRTLVLNSSSVVPDCGTTSGS